MGQGLLHSDVANAATKLQYPEDLRIRAPKLKSFLIPMPRGFRSESFREDPAED